jgi:Na+-translocating ferredoxin:NAD+ oxidoreductase RNF subunit RnfB
MGHVVAKQAHRDLQSRLDKMPIGAPAHRAFFDMLAELYTEEEARIAAAIPLKLASLRSIVRSAGTERERTRQVLDTLTEKGLVVDLPGRSGESRYALNPTVVGFFEFTMMRVREDVDQKRVAELMWEYMREDPDRSFLHMLASTDTFIGRPLVHESALGDGDFTEILDWQKASAIVDSADAWAEGLCHCRHVKQHLGHPCSDPPGHCMSLGMGAEYLIRHDLAQRIDKARALEILDEARELGHVHMADNVKYQPSFICSCCSCCCEMLEGFRALPEMATVVSSNFVGAVEDAECSGCGTCVKACPIGAIALAPASGTDKIPKRKKAAVVDEDRCLGCGVCVPACDVDGLAMRPADRRVHTPDTMMERMVRQAVDRGTLPYLVANDPAKLTHRVLGSLLSAVMKLPPTKQLLAQDQLKSRFVEAMLNAPKHRRHSASIDRAKAALTDRSAASADSRRPSAGSR